MGPNMDILLEYMLDGIDCNLEDTNAALNNWDEFTNKLKQQLETYRDRLK